MQKNLHLAIYLKALPIAIWIYARITIVSTILLNNTIIGNRSLTKVGGISVSTLLGIENHPQIEGNTITENRYGITVAGNNSSGSISNNTLMNNNTEPVPDNGGSGISLNGTGSTVMALKIEGNQIRGHLWGITIIGTAQADLGGGTLGSTGGNIFKDNGNGGNIYALFNSTANPISATNNCWREGELSNDAMVEAVINHSVDDPALGTVNFKPYLCAAPLSTTDAMLSKSKVYPNPSNGTFTYNAENSGTMRIIDASGKVVYTGNVNKGNNTISLQAPAGVYFLNDESQGQKRTTKLIIK